MEQIEIYNQQLPDNIPELAKFALVGREKLVAVRAEIRAIEKVGLAKEVLEQKKAEEQAIAEAVLDAEVKIGELSMELPKAQGTRTDKELMDNAVHKFERAKKDILAENGISQRQASRFETLAKHPEMVEQAKAEARENGEAVKRQDVLDKIKAEVDSVVDANDMFRTASDIPEMPGDRPSQKDSWKSYVAEKERRIQEIDKIMANSDTPNIPLIRERMEAQAVLDGERRNKNQDRFDKLTLAMLEISSLPDNELYEIFGGLEVVDENDTRWVNRLNSSFLWWDINAWTEVPARFVKIMKEVARGNAQVAENNNDDNQGSYQEDGKIIRIRN